jgi:four helix bundle protein
MELGEPIRNHDDCRRIGLGHEKSPVMDRAVLDWLEDKLACGRAAVENSGRFRVLELEVRSSHSERRRGESGSAYHSTAVNRHRDIRLLFRRCWVTQRVGLVTLQVSRLAMILRRRRNTMGDFKRLVAWQKAHAFVVAVHSAFKGRNTTAAPGLRAQILRAVSAISDNLAEGCGLRSRRALARYAETAYASAKEVENDLIKSRDLGILTGALCEDLLRQGDEVARLCFSLTRLPPGGE